MIGLARKPQKLPDYFTPEEADALVAAAPSYPTRMAFRIMLQTVLRVSESLSLRRNDLLLNQDPPVLSIRPEAPGNEARKGREVPIPADLLEGLADLASFHSRDHSRPMLEISRQWVGESMKQAAAAAGIDPARAHPYAFLHTYSPKLRPPGDPAAGPAGVAGASVPGRHTALRGAGRHPPLLGGQAVMLPVRSDKRPVVDQDGAEQKLMDNAIRSAIMLLAISWRRR